jgi:2,5-diketo-D-gluconate reductase B
MLRTVSTALKAGFRHIDTAQIYGNEAEVGECIALSGIARSEIFVTSKVWVSNYPKRRFRASVDESLQNLKSDYIDLLLLHWPSEGVSLAEQLDNLNSVAQSGKVRHIGVSNFNSELVSHATRLSREPLVTNQFEYHPYLNQSVLVENTRRVGMAVTAYCAMAIGGVFADPTLARIAAGRNKTIAQVVLRWLVQQDGVVALSRTTNLKRVVENVAIFDFALEQEEMRTIHALVRPNSRIVDPSGLAPQWDAERSTGEVARG